MEPIEIKLSGELWFDEQEGGYCAPDIIIDGKSLHEVIAKKLGVRNMGRIGEYEKEDFGTCELVLKISPK